METIATPQRRNGLDPAPDKEPNMAKYFYIQPFSKAVAQLENTVDSAIAEAQKSDGAKSVLKTELENIRHEIAKIERALARFERENASGKSAGV